MKVMDRPHYVWLDDVSETVNLERLRGTVGKLHL